MSDTPHDNDVTTTARRIARQANAYGGNMRPGVLAFDADRRGGEWYSQRSWPSAAIVYPLTHGRVTARQVQAWLDECNGEIRNMAAWDATTF
jgi:hypothetical protein